ncbi:pyrroline-5-carboxylate reductase [Paenibacillus koleovorans]|uniref:pyrroline-5-carboxylate reductase n=1 Tax=Paenibacillus koleovorans TaxID=121608 RepID=UPI000FD902B9|nr:pyrroline-5-carboxylate reductase [Paenibacillus koleovorans]
MHSETIGVHALAECQICFIGAGSMAEAIFRGLIGRNIVDAARIQVVNRQDNEKLLRLQETYGVSTSERQADKDRFIREADIVVLAMKPKDAGSGIAAIRPLLRENQLIVSVVAGLSISTIESLLDGTFPIVRTMPNTSSTIGLGAAGVSFSPAVTPEQREMGLELFRAVGEAVEVEEPLMEIVTGVSGSGPAYIYYMMEAMIAAGVRDGLSPETARQLTIQTVLGAAEMVRVTGEDPADLRRKVTSPNGATQAALQKMDEYRFTEGVMNAVRRSAERSREMGDDIAAQYAPGKES